MVNYTSARRHMNFFYMDDDDRCPRKSRKQQLQRWDQLHRMEWSPHYKGVPPHAVACGHLKKTKLYLGRAYHMGSITPGYVNPAKKVCYIAWGGNTEKKREYEILCTPGVFVPCNDSTTMLQATPAGVSEQGEPLYIGRADMEGHQLHGKVQRSHSVCYIPFNGKEQFIKTFEIFVKSHIPGPPSPLPTPQNNEETTCWVAAADGAIPPNAIVGGWDRERLYIGRARHDHSITPGKVMVSHGACFIPWGGFAHRKTEYEVLANSKGSFVQCRGAEIPLTALVAGHSEQGEPLYIGRVSHEGAMILGKVHPSHGVCYIPYDGQELAFIQYEIYIR